MKKILFVATRSPYPPRDGGAVLMASTIEGLRALGNEVRLVAPDHPRSLAAAFGRSLFSGRPTSVERHSHPGLAAAVDAVITDEKFDVVHVEQPQAMLQAAAAFRHRIPVVLRAQNVESELWRMLAEVRPARRWIALREARRLVRWEADAVERATITVALTTDDARLLTGKAPKGRVSVVRMPMASALPAGEASLEGSPSIVLVSSAWFPNRDGVLWFLDTIWPEVARRLPLARLHVFGVARRHGANVTFHPPPADSRSAFCAGSIVVVPLRIASGARVRILEAWARGLPVVATPVACAGLDAAPGEGVLAASTPEDFAAAFAAIAMDANLARSIVDAGRAVLRRWHDPQEIARALDAIYAEVSGVSAGRTA